MIRKCQSQWSLLDYRLHCTRVKCLRNLQENFFIQVKSKVWVAHSKGRKHLENIKLLKMRHAEQSSMIQTQVPQTSLGSGKRVANSLQEESLPPSAKKKKGKLWLVSRLFLGRTLTNKWIGSAAAEEPEEQQAETSYNGEKTPWQKTKDSGGTRSEKPVSKHTIAGVPEGFFDDEMIDSRVSNKLYCYFLWFLSFIFWCKNCKWPSASTRFSQFISMIFDFDVFNRGSK